MRPLFQRQPIRHNGIEYSFSRRLSRLLVYENSRIPDLQSASIDELHSVFPRDQWRVENGSNGIRSVVLGSSRGEVLMPRISGSALVALRFYGSPVPQGSLKVTVRSDRGAVQRQDGGLQGGRGRRIDLESAGTCVHQFQLRAKFQYPLDEGEVHRVVFDVEKPRRLSFDSMQVRDDGERVECWQTGGGNEQVVMDETHVRNIEP